MAASSVGTSVAAAVGLLNVDPARGNVYPAWAGWIMVALVLLVGVCVVVVLWPASRWAFGVEPDRVLQDLDRPVDDVYRDVTRALARVAAVNVGVTRLRQRAFECGAVLLILQTAFIVISLGLGGRVR